MRKSVLPKRLTPMLNVADIERSLNFYMEALGLELVTSRAVVQQWRWAHLRLGACDLMLSESGGPGAVTTAWTARQTTHGRRSTTTIPTTWLLSTRTSDGKGFRRVICV
jgi:catechol 2,3-dioxygenase-like lactoylglutathione lyase family enzyme